MFFVCSFFEVSESPLFAKSDQKWPQKGAKMRPKVTKMATLRPHQTYGIYNTDHTLGRFGWAPGAPFFLHCFLDTVFLCFLWFFVILGAKRVPQRGETFARKMSKNRFRRQIAPRRSRSPKRVAKSRQNVTKSDPNLMILVPKSHWSQNPEFKQYFCKTKISSAPPCTLNVFWHGFGGRVLAPGSEKPECSFRALAIAAGTVAARRAANWIIKV